MMYINIGNVNGLPEPELKMLSDLTAVFNYHNGKNAEKVRYYEGHITLNEVNLGIALPQAMRGLEIGCEWGSKCVDVLAARSMFDGFVGANGAEVSGLTQIMDDNRILAEYQKAVRDELKFGCTFAVLAGDSEIGCNIRFASPMDAAARWNAQLGRIDCGMTIIDGRIDDSDKTWKPSRIRLDTDDAVWMLTRDGFGWTAEYLQNKMGRPLMVPLIWNATSAKPFGRSRIKEPVRRLIQSYVRTIANATIGLEFSTSPQKYLMGVTDDQYDAIINDKFRQYVGSIIAGTVNPETGERPTFGQLQQGTLNPHVEMLRMLATQFSAATGLTVTDTGVVNDANPTSSDAILAQSQTLVLLAEQLNAGNGDALKLIAQMAQAIARDVTLDQLTNEERDVVAHFKNPAMPSVSVTADAAIKIASARENFAGTDVFLEMIGFDQADIRRIRAQESRARGLKLLEEFEDEDFEEGVAGVREPAGDGQSDSGAEG